MKTDITIVEVGVPIPKRRTFDYLLPDEMSAVVGGRVSVSFGPRKLTGIVLAHKSQSEVELGRLKPIDQCLDQQPLFDAPLLKLLHWASEYYQHPIGEVLATALPVNLRKGQEASLKAISQWQLTEKGQTFTAEELGNRAKKQQLLLQAFQQNIPPAQLSELYTPAVFKGLEEKALLEKVEKLPTLTTDWANKIQLTPAPVPNVEQALIITQMQLANGFKCHLLEGITGSGKTEVYLQSIEPVLARGQQVLILVPEIGLTPQTVSRFESRFGLEVGVLHSGLNDQQRLNVWIKAKAGSLAIIIGTRSAIFTPMANPGMIIVDEEHDGSFKQQDSFRYHARDLAAMRANIDDIPLLLGSATPSLESLSNALKGKYQHFQLQQRAANAILPRYQLLDIKNQPLQYGLSMALKQRINQHLDMGNQVMIFLNRRGFSPAMICHQCGHVENCRRCDKSYTLHKQLNKLQCHHCGSARSIPRQCEECGSDQLTSLGVGTEQLEMGLSELFPKANTVRIDSDSVRGKDKLNQLLDDINQLKYQVLLGTQILAKGHHFSHVTLVAILDVDGALFSADFRAAENLAQLITQVAGRAGRAEKPGEVWLQTHHPEHPLLQDLVNNGYGHFARYALQERQHAHLPPFSFQALFKAEAHNAQQAFQFLADVSQLCQSQHVGVMGPLPALMEKRQGRFRMQLVLQSAHRSAIRQLLQHILPQVENLPLSGRVRWSLDVDPQDFS